MSFQGHIERGVVVFDEPVDLPNGTEVRVEPIIRPRRDWDAAARAVREMRDYDYEALELQKRCDEQHAGGQVP